MQCCMNTNRPQPIALDTFCALITNINFYQPALANEIEKRLRNGFAQFLITQLYEVLKFLITQLYEVLKFHITDLYEVRNFDKSFILRATI